MAGEFKQCSNGHYYQGASCPYCNSGSRDTGKNSSAKTGLFVNSGELEGSMATEIQGSRESIATTMIEGRQEAAAGSMAASASRMNPAPANRTVFGEEPEVEVTATGQHIEKKVYRSNRKLVGWLVTYSFDPMGVDYKLYEGRNVIGRDLDCNITVSDNMLSGKHAVLLFRADKYSISDSQSSHGTFINGEDIELEPRYLKDGDIIRMGETEFKFRTSI